MKNMSHPCGSCPFAISCTPGALGGSPAETFIGQVFGPFVLPCHSQKDYDQVKWDPKASQCAGAAHFRHHIGVAPYLPEQIHHLPASEKVFPSPAHFYAHHKGISLTEAVAQLRQHPPAELLQIQMGRATNKITKIADLTKESP